MKTENPGPEFEKLPETTVPETKAAAPAPVETAPETEEASKPSRAEKAFGILSGVSFALAVAAFLVMVYIYTDKDLTVSPYLTASLSLAFGFGIGFGMLFRTFQRKEENVSSINYFFKIGFSFLVLLTALLTFLFSLLKIRLS
ncbi:MAG: hypothetical protein IKP55_07070 [Clostridia bacterium]|nr:hypothetical protein [Clostridia bacterium]